MKNKDSDLSSIPQGRENTKISNFSPRTLWVGIGCKRGSSGDLMEWAVMQTLASYGLSREAIAGFATLDRKAQEPGLMALAENWQLPCLAIPQEILAQVPVPNPSLIVAQAVGISSVAEAAAIVAAVSSLGDPLVLLSNSLPKLFPKQVWRSPKTPGLVTLAIAEALSMPNPV